MELPKFSKQLRKFHRISNLWSKKYIISHIFAINFVYVFELKKKCHKKFKLAKYSLHRVDQVATELMCIEERDNENATSHSCRTRFSYAFTR